MATKKQASSNLEKAIEKMSIGGRNQFADCFNNFLDLALSYFCINSVDGAVTCGDALRMDTENFTFFTFDKLRNLASGAVFTTYWQYSSSDIEKVQEKREKWWLWIAEHGWVKYTHRVWADVQPIIDDIENAIGGNPPTEGIAENIQKELEENNKIDHLPTEIKTDENGQISLF